MVFHYWPRCLTCAPPTHSGTSETPGALSVVFSPLWNAWSYYGFLLCWATIPKRKVGTCCGRKAPLLQSFSTASSFPTLCTPFILPFPSSHPSLHINQQFAYIAPCSFTLLFVCERVSERSVAIAWWLRPSKQCLWGNGEIESLMDWQNRSAFQDCFFDHTSRTMTMMVDPRNAWNGRGWSGPCRQGKLHSWDPASRKGYQSTPKRLDLWGIVFVAWLMARFTIAKQILGFASISQ